MAELVEPNSARSTTSRKLSNYFDFKLHEYFEDWYYLKITVKGGKEIDLRSDSIESLK